MFKKIFAVMISLIILFSLTACNKDDKKNIILITDVHGKKDGFYNQFTYDGLKKASSKFDFKLTVYEPKTEADYETNIEKAIAQNPVMIVFSSPELEKTAVTYAKNNPDMNFILIDAPGDLNLDNMQDSSNIFSIEFNRSQAGFISGIVAGSIATTKALFIGTNEYPAYIEYESGFKAGIKTVNPALGVEISYFNPKMDTAQAKEKTASYIADGCEVIYAVNKNQGIYEAADEADIPVIGYDYNYARELRKGSNSLVMTVNKQIADAVFLAVEEYFNGTFKGQIKYYSLTENCLQANIINKKVITDDIQNTLTAWTDKIKNDNIPLPKTRREFEKFVPPVIAEEKQN